MQDERPRQLSQLLELTGTTGLPLASSLAFTPMTLAVLLLKTQLITGDGMVDGGQ